MHRASVLLVALLFLPFAAGHGGVDPGSWVSPSVTDAARQLYGGPVFVQRATSPEFEAAFPTLHLYAVREADVAPEVMHLMSWLPSAGAARDVTTSFGAIMADGGLVALSASNALAAAKAYAAVANREFHPWRAVVGAADAAELGVPLTDPSVVATANGFRATLTTWSFTNGVLASWTIDFALGSLSSASWTVDATFTGPSRYDAGAPTPPAGTRVANAYSGGHAVSATTASGAPALLPHEAATEPRTVFLSGTNFDGSTWVATWPTRLGPPTVEALEMGQAAIEGGIAAYSKMVQKNQAACGGATNPGPNLGYVVNDLDCRYHIDLMDPATIYWCGGACAYDSDASDDVYVTVSPILLAQLNANGYYTNPAKHTLAAVMVTVMGHELYHNIQYVLEVDESGARWMNWGGLLEGTARMIQTLVAPDVEQDPSSMFYVDANLYQKESKSRAGQVLATHGGTSADFCSQAYRTALFWGDVQARYGLEAVTEVMRRADAHDKTAPTCTEGIARSLQAALGGPAGGTNASRAAFEAFMKNEFAPRDFTWNGEDWSMHLVPVAPKGTLYPESEYHTAMAEIHPYGFAFLKLPVGSDYVVGCSWSGGNVYLMVREPAGATSTLVTCSGQPDLTVPATLATEAYLAAVRVGTSPAHLSVWTP